MGSRGFGVLESAVMDRLWRRAGPTTVREVFEDLSGDRSLAYTTVLSTMTNLHRKGWLEQVRESKAFRYVPVLTREQYGARLMHDALRSGGESATVLACFVEGINGEQSVSLSAALLRYQQSHSSESVPDLPTK
ncbi:BlaI/MecI/CopY family transcriptional regulator [Nocardia farcinica]|uniref:BlaI/MecI/CopY family transcriptional regulator n=1 Tax=Nocardia farcinica TaxID=37329 RepID=UPI0018959DE9|nr:BlaI/MecI/CopY family transcriptional regulator [Nocardia farcinica]MBF6422820.1 BlaI/MecI/CopY family transcriptional regulator [Nocardia farcinica]MBF6434553.1 BlaI/MecI/CopY family transcriptional regulator [Nocardia farcinica]MBF6505639.1 BlaI/MecI/CopY family transcriptional regulator [Nocardia farcinica]